VPETKLCVTELGGVVWLDRVDSAAEGGGGVVDVETAKVLPLELMGIVEASRLFAMYGGAKKGSSNSQSSGKTTSYRDVMMGVSACFGTVLLSSSKVVGFHFTHEMHTVRGGRGSRSY
jgi:hypothetical protein